MSLKEIIGTCVVAVVLIAIVVLIIIKMRKDKKKPNPVVRFIRRAAGFVRRRLMR